MDAAKVEALIETWKARGAAFWNVVVVPLGGLRTLLLATVAVVLLAADWKAAKALGFGVGLVAAALTFLHWYRKSQHPYIDLKVFAEKAQEDPVASALVLLGVFAFMAVILLFILFVVIR